MLAVLSKIAALYVQHFEDETVLCAVDEVENLVSGLSRNIWQKITILDRLRKTQRQPGQESNGQPSSKAHGDYPSRSTPSSTA